MVKVKIKNFQSIADTEFEVDGFTVIVGKNNRGKSAIIRAIDSALSNRLGNNFIRWGKLQTEVGLIKNDLDLFWVKGETASYKINKKTFTSLNKTIPKPITEAGFKKLEIADEKLNPLIAHQFEELFLINKSGPFVTEAISTLYDLNDINDADSLCQKKLRASKGLLKTRNADMETVSDKIRKFDGLDELKKKWEEVKKIAEDSEKLKKEIMELDCFKAQLDVIRKNLKEFETLKDVKIPDASKPEKPIQELRWLETTSIVFQKTFNTVQKLKEISGIAIPSPQLMEVLIQEVSEICDLTNKLKNTVITCNNCKTALEGLKGLESTTEKIKEIEGRVSELTNILSMEQCFFSAATSLKLTRNDMEQAINEWNTLQVEYDKFKVCPLCNNPLKVVVK